LPDHSDGGDAAAGSAAMAAYRRLEERFRRLTALRDAEAMLHWDLATMMPPGGMASRAEQLATLKALRHGLITAPEVADWLAAAEEEGSGADPGLDAWQRANVVEMRRLHAHATALSEAQVEALSRAASACEAAWREARAEACFATVLPSLTALLDQVRAAAAAKAQALRLSPYDALLDEYEPDGRSAAIDAVFADLARFLPGFLAQVMERQAREPAPLAPPGPFPIERQRQLGIRCMELFGFDFHHGRLDVSLHPFCGGTPDDVRITTRYDEADFRGALMGVLHETGHALYERGLPAPWRGQPVGDARGMVLHESQSLLIEMQVCRSRPFLAFAAPVIAEVLGGADAGHDGAAWQADNLYRHYTRVAPGFIRVDADEVTYPAHVILRYRLERAMIAGDLAPADLPGAWADGMAALLGVVPPDDRQGCLQDIHWYDGAWGYFPTYTLGAMAAAQLFAAAKGALPGLAADLARGDPAPLIGWLREKVHGFGSSLATDAILAAATGRPLDATAFKRHLSERYLS
jgi:carboxypeptidase Taq